MDRIVQMRHRPMRACEWSCSVELSSGWFLGKSSGDVSPEKFREETAALSLRHGKEVQASSGANAKGARISSQGMLNSSATSLSADFILKSDHQLCLSSCTF